jgi:DNA-binding transcriptional LysR family regulator
MSGLDLTDLRILDELQRTGSISRTAEKIGLSQPSVSVRLSRLRRHFKDLLFVRAAHLMVPTHRGDRAIVAARQALELLERAVSPEDKFDSTTSQRTFRICMTGLGQLAILPKLLIRIKAKAPGICIDVLNSAGEIERMLESGEADIATGVRLERQKGLVTQTLFQERFVCLARKNHRNIGQTLTLQQLLNESHVTTNIRSASMALWIMDQALSLQKLPRHIALRVPSLLGLAQIVANTDLLAIVPLHTALAFAEEGQVKVLELPVEAPSFPVVQYWHQRYDSDPGNRWLRTAIHQLFSEPAEAANLAYHAAGSKKNAIPRRRPPYPAAPATAVARARRT